MECEACNEILQTALKGLPITDMVRYHTCNHSERIKREDCLLRDIIISSAVDVSKIKNDPPYPLVWDKDFNFIGHKVFGDLHDNG